MKQKERKINLFLVTIISIFFIFLFNLSSFAATCNLPGDFCGPMGDPTPDGKVDFNDLMVFATAYGSESGDPNWNALCDICGYLGDPSPDDKVNFDDLMVFATNYGKECPSEEGILEAASAQIDLEIGGVVEVTDEESEIYRTSLVIDPMNKEQLVNSRGLSEIAILLNAQVLGTNYLGNLQGWVITPVGVTAAEDIIGLIQGSLEITYNEDKLSNSGVAKDSSVNVYRVLCVFDPITFMPVPVPGVSWEEVPEEMITHETDKVKIEIGIGDLLYLYTLTVTNCEPPTNLGTPLPGDLLYRLSEVGVNDNWVPGHVGIYVGERYGDHDDDPSTPDTVYNVIEALGSLFGYIGLGPDEVLRTHYEDITKFGGDKYVYMGAREPAVRKLTHQERNQLIAYLEDNVGDDYAFSETVFGIWFGLARGDIVKGDDDQYNCVGLSEAAYESVSIDIVSDEDEGNSLLPLFPQDNLLSPQEQLFRTVPASGIMDYNNAPVISSLEMVPENPALGDWVTVTCHTTDQDGDDLTYEWTIEDGSENIISGPFIEDEQIDLQILLNNFLIKCTAFDNYGGEGKFTKAVNLGGEKIVFSSNRDGNYDIWMMNPNGTDQAKIIDTGGNDSTPRISPDGLKIAFCSDYLGNSEIYLMNVNGTNLVNLTNNGSNDRRPVFSPDGTQVAFMSDRNGEYDIWLMSVGGGTASQVTDLPCIAGSPCFSPDGEKIVFKHRPSNPGNSYTNDLYEIDLTTSQITQLTFMGGSDDYPCFSSDGSQIVFYHCEENWKSNIYIINSDGSNIRKLTETYSYVEDCPWFSPDDSQIVFRSDRDGNCEIYTMDSNGDFETNITNNSSDDNDPSWGECQF